MDIINFLSIRKNDKHKWVKYYELETHKYYDYIVDILPANTTILEIGSGGGVFYNKHKHALLAKNNKYTGIDINEDNIIYSNDNCDYVDFRVEDVSSYTESEFQQFNVLLLVQSYIQIPNIEDIFKRYFLANPNGSIIMVNTIFPDFLGKTMTVLKTHVLPFIFNNDCVSGKALTIKNLDQLSVYLDKEITNSKICKSLSGFDEYVTII